MIDRTTKLRWRRRVRRSKRQVEDLSSQAEEQLERHLFKRLSRLPGVFRFTGAWVTLVALLIVGLVVQTRALNDLYLTPLPVPGGTYVEGILGSFTNANPLYATNSVDVSVSRLVFAGLLTVDQKNQLVGDLAQGWTTDERGVTYTVRLKDNLYWQDGQPLTAEDVVFTYKLIQNPDAKSPLAASWQGITVTSPDSRTIVFTLPNALSAFPYSMTNGIVPKHLLKDVPVAQLRSVNFNTTKPVGAGPFRWEGIQVTGQTPETREEQIALLPNTTYYAGQPKLGRFIIRSFRDERQLIDSFRRQELTGAVGIDSLPQDLQQLLTVHEYNIPTQGEAMIFLKNSNPILSDVKVRQALVAATDTNKIITGLGYPVIPARGPLLKAQVGYDPSLLQAGYNLDGAKRLLDEAGWKVGQNGLRSKDNTPLRLTFYYQNREEFISMAVQLQAMWRIVGVDLQLPSDQSDAELQYLVSSHGYDVLLYNIGLGIDPDVFPYWHSSQADPRSQNRLNFSEYKSKTADQALEAGRTRSDPGLRAIKYRPFLEAWRADAPAIALYQPRFFYITRGTVFGLEPTTVSTPTDRYANVANWMIREEASVEE